MSETNHPNRKISPEDRQARLLAERSERAVALNVVATLHSGSGLPSDQALQEARVLAEWLRTGR